MTHRTLSTAAVVALATTLYHTHDFWNAGVGFTVGLLVARFGLK